MSCKLGFSTLSVVTAQITLLAFLSLAKSDVTSSESELLP